MHQAEADIGMPNNVRGSFQGTARSAQQSQNQQPLLIAAALVVIYIVLGILYESLVHPITVLSTLPSAGVGAVLALLMFKMEFSIIALIGVFLLLGIVKKNAILIIDFALEAERSRGLSALEAVREACLLRFRPILMTTLAAALGALPLAIGFRRRRRTAAAARHRHHWRPDREPAADLADHAGRVYLARQAASSQPGRAPTQPHRQRLSARRAAKTTMSITMRPPPSSFFSTSSSGHCRLRTYWRAVAPSGPTINARPLPPGCYKEAQNWVPAAPADALERGPWWLLFDDPVLNELAARIEVSNQNVAAATAAYAQAARWCASNAHRCFRW